LEGGKVNGFVVECVTVCVSNSNEYVEVADTRTVLLQKIGEVVMLLFGGWKMWKG
jgi:hypothetical protein